MVVDARGMVRSLRDRGLRFTSCLLVEEGEGTAADADWNMRDLLHPEWLHPAFAVIPGTMTSGETGGVFLTRLGGISWPATAVHGVGEDGVHLRFSSQGPLVVVVETRLLDLVAERHRAETRIWAGAPPGFHLALPLILASLVRRHRRLAEEDAPVRKRRATLRRSGHRFLEDGGASYQRSISRTIDGVIPPPLRTPEEGSLSLKGFEEKTILWGEDGAWGVRAWIDREWVRLYPRTCRHAGACLDEQGVTKRGTLLCPWHGRPHPPLAILPRNVDGDALLWGRLRVSVRGESLSFRPLPLAEAVPEP